MGEKRPRLWGCCVRCVVCVGGWVAGRCADWHGLQLLRCAAVRWKRVLTGLFWGYWGSLRGRIGPPAASAQNWAESPGIYVETGSRYRWLRWWCVLTVLAMGGTARTQPKGGNFPGANNERGSRWWCVLTVLAVGGAARMHSQRNQSGQDFLLQP